MSKYDTNKIKILLRPPYYLCLVYLENLKEKIRFFSIFNIIELLFFPRKLVITLHDSGFFSNFNKVMNHLVVSLYHSGIRAIKVKWYIVDQDTNAMVGKEFVYGQPENGNIWECFFEELPFSRNSFFRCIKTNRYASCLITGPRAYYLYKSGQGWREKYYKTFKKYIRIKPHIQQKVDELYSRYMAGKYCIGVHIRNEAQGVEQPDKKAVAVDTYITKISSILQSKRGKTVIFLATDVEENVKKFRNIFGDSIIIQPGAKRLEGYPSGEYSRQIHHCNPNPSLKLGEDVLIDCLLLAKCNIFIHAISNIATAVLYINPKIKSVLLVQGSNESGKLNRQVQYAKDYA